MSRIVGKRSRQRLRAPKRASIPVRTKAAGLLAIVSATALICSGMPLGQGRLDTTGAGALGAGVGKPSKAHSSITKSCQLER